jgi:hypothetical protein
MAYAFERFEDFTGLVGLQTGLGSPATITAGNAFQFFEGQFALQADSQSRRKAVRWLDASSKRHTNRRVMLTGTIDLIGNTTLGTASPQATILRACGYAQTLVVATSATYSPVSTGFEYSTAHFYRGARRFVAEDCLGSLTEISFAIDQFPSAKFEIMGPYTTPTEASVPSGIDLAAFVDPPLIDTPNWFLSLNGVEVNAKSLTLSPAANKKISRGSEVRAARYTGRETSGQIRMTPAAFADFNPYTFFGSGALIPLITRVIDGAYKCELSVPNIKFGVPSEVDDEGDVAWEIPFDCEQIASGTPAHAIKFY